MHLLISYHIVNFIILYTFSCILLTGSLNIYVFIWLHWVLVVACGIFSCFTGTLSLGVCDLVPQPEVELQTPCIGSMESQPLDHQGSAAG